MTKIILKVVDWMKARNFFGEGGATIEMQKLKFFEEYGEYCGNKVRGQDMKDDLGDQLVVLIALIGIADKKPDWGYFEPRRINIQTDTIPTMICENDFYRAFHAVMNLAEKEGYKPLECLEFAYNEIKDRKGKFINGSFVKESDLK
jgi:hypothetical protein